MPGIDTTQGSDPGTSNLLITFDEAYGPIRYTCIIMLTLYVYDLLGANFFDYFLYVW